MLRHKNIGSLEGKSNFGELTESIIENPNSYKKESNPYRKDLLKLFLIGKISENDLFAEFDRYSCYLAKIEKESDLAFENTISNIEFKEILPYLQREVRYG